MPRIAIVEDDELLSFLFEETCKSAGLQVAWNARGVNDALAMLANDEPDVLLLDFALDGERDGIELLAATDRCHPGLTTILATGWDYGRLAARIDFVAPDHLLQKPVLPSVLASTLAAICGKAGDAGLAQAA